MNEQNVISFMDAEIIDFEKIDDPLHDLLNEFSSIEAEMEQNLVEIEKNSTEHFLNEWSNTEILDFYKSRLELLDESRKRLKFYLDEIETFLLSS